MEDMRQLDADRLDMRDDLAEAREAVLTAVVKPQLRGLTVPSVTTYLTEHWDYRLKDNIKKTRESRTGPSMVEYIRDALLLQEESTEWLSTYETRSTCKKMQLVNKKAGPEPGWRSVLDLRTVNKWLAPQPAPPRPRDD
jgi:hypothetical protein